MTALIRQQRHFLHLFLQTTPIQRKALLQTVTKHQMKALSQIAHNVVKGNLPLSSVEKKRLKNARRLLHLLGDTRLGFVHKKQLVQSKQNILRLLVTAAVTYLKPVLE